MSECEVRVEACFRRLLPEGSILDFGARQREILTLAGQWSVCVETFGHTSAPGLGCLLALVAVALRDPNAFLRWNGTQWEVVALYPGDDGRSVFGRAATKADALVCALEAAP